MHDHRREETAREFLARRHRERLEMARKAIARDLLQMPGSTLLPGPTSESRVYPHGYGSRLSQ